MTQSKQLMKNTAIYAVGNIGSKVLAYIMVLVYSHYISSEELGYYDLILATVSMIYPIVACQISDAVYRYLIDAEDKTREIILATTFKFLLVTTSISVIIFSFIASEYNLKYSVWIALYLVSTIFYFFFHDAIRGLAENRKYAMVGILNSIFMLLIEIFGLLILKMGVLALLVANVFSMFFCIGLMICWQDQFWHLFRTKFNKAIFLELIKYSSPLVPNTICWWVVNSSDRYIILLFLGASFNGIYAISNKFPTILTTITGIFYLAWQESAIKEYNSPNRDIFFSDIFNKYYNLLFSLCVAAIPMTHIVIELFVGAEYVTAWQYSGFLYLGAAFSALCSFLGLGYQISKETIRSTMTTIIAAVINLIVNLVLIKNIGLHAASLSTFIAYLFLFFYRIIHTKRYFTLSVSWKEFYSRLGLVFLVMIETFLIRNLIVSAFVAVCSAVYIFIINKEIFSPIIISIKNKMRNQNR